MADIEKNYETSQESLKQLLEMTRFLVDTSLNQQEFDVQIEDDGRNSVPLMVNRETATPAGGIQAAIMNEKGPASPQSRPVSSLEALRARTVEHIRQTPGFASTTNNLGLDKTGSCSLCCDYNSLVLNAFRLSVVAFTAVSSIQKARLDPTLFLNQCCQSRLKYPLRTTNCKCKKASESIQEIPPCNSPFEYMKPSANAPGVTRNADQFLSA